MATELRPFGDSDGTSVLYGSALVMQGRGDLCVQRHLLAW